MNTAWLDEDLATLKHLTVGLIDEQVRVTQVMPRGAALGDVSAFAQRLDYSEAPCLRALSRRRVVGLVGEMRASGVNLIHALESSLWPAGIQLSERTGWPVVLGVADGHCLRRIPRLLRRTDPGRLAFLASSQPLADAVRQALVGTSDALPVMPVGLARPGVHLGKPTVRSRTAEEPMCLVISGNGTYDAYYQAVLEAVRRLVDHDPATQIFLDGQGGDQHQIWRAARRLNLMANLSLIPRRLGHRELLLSADVLVHPQTLGRVRPLCVQAMAGGVPILAVDDPWLDYLVDGQTARVLPAAEPQPHWLATELIRWHDHPEEGLALGERARQWVQEHHLASGMVSAVLAMYRTVTGEGLPFPKTMISV